MSRRSITVIGVDPGDTVGWSVGYGHTVDSFGKAPWAEFLTFLEYGLAAGVFERVVSERIDPRRWDNEMKLTVGVSFTIQWLTSRAGVVFAEVNAADKAKTMPAVLQRIDNKHARDAEAIRLWDLRYGRW